MKIYITILFIFVFGLAAFGQTESINKGDAVVPKFSKVAVKFDKVKVWQAKEQYSAVISKTSSGGFAINDNAKWNEMIFPMLIPYKVEVIDISKKKPTRVVLKGTENLIEITIPAELNLQEVLSNILYKGTPDNFIESDYFKQLEAKILPIMFIGLDSIPFETQHLLMRESNYDILAYGIAKLKEKEYFRVKYSDTSVYNNLRLNTAERNARETQDAINRAKQIFKKTGKINEIEGIKVETYISSKSFLDTYAAPTQERYEIYIPFDLLQKFIDAEITNQDLVDGSIVLLEGSRVKINLTNYSS